MLWRLLKSRKDKISKLNRSRNRVSRGRKLGHNKNREKDQTHNPTCT